VNGFQTRSTDNHEMRFVEVEPRGGVKQNRVRDLVAPMVLSLAVHAAVTWDAQSTNYFFNHTPNGFRPRETDPLMRPFAGKALMYPMANLLFAVPVDLLMLKTHNSRAPIRMMSYAAASVWVGVEVRQSFVNIGNAHLRSPVGNGTR
jgi:hypothetical protein